MITCPICRARIPTDYDARQTGDCQCSRETMARLIIEYAKIQDDGIAERERIAAEVERLRGLLRLVVLHHQDRQPSGRGPWAVTITQDGWDAIAAECAAHA